MTESAEKTLKIKTASKQQVLNWVVKARQKMQDKKDLIIKSFQVTGITSTDPNIVHSDEVLQRAMEAVLRQLSLDEEDENEDDISEDPFANIELEDFELED